MGVPPRAAAALPLGSAARLGAGPPHAPAARGRPALRSSATRRSGLAHGQKVVCRELRIPRYSEKIWFDFFQREGVAGTRHAHCASDAPCACSRWKGCAPRPADARSAARRLGARGNHTVVSPPAILYTGYPEAAGRPRFCKNIFVLKIQNICTAYPVLSILTVSEGISCLLRLAQWLHLQS